MGWITLVAWVVTLGLAWVGFGTYLGTILEGNDPSLIPRGPLVAPLAGLALSLVLTGLWARGLWVSPASAPAPRGLGRRRFLIGTAASLGGLAAALVAPVARNWRWKTISLDQIFANETPTSDPHPRPAWQGARVREYRRLGRTEAQISDISLGSARIHPERGGVEIARAAIERGVNYFDTSPDYSASGSERALGEAMQGVREQMFVATKFCTPQGDLPAGSSVEQYMQVVEGSLERLQTSWVDLVHVHAVNDVARILDPNMHEAFERLRDQGKVRFLGLSSHTPNLELVAETALDDGRFDVMMLAYHHGAWPRLGELIERASEQDVGIVAMKTLKGAKHRGLLEFREEADSYAQAAFKWVLANPAVSGLVVSFSEPGQVDEYLYASGGRPSDRDFALLEKYDQLIAGKHCFQGCGACLESCPEGLRIDDVLRYRMYFEDYGDEKEAMRLYARLGRQADVCTGCSAPCLGACPFGVPIAERTRETHTMLSLEELRA